MKYQFYRHGTTVSGGINEKFLEIFKHFYSQKKFPHPAYSTFKVDADGFEGKAQPGAMIDYFKQFWPNNYKTLAGIIPDTDGTLFVEFNTVFSLTDAHRDALFDSGQYKAIVDDSFETNLYRAEALRETFIELYGYSPVILNNGVYKYNPVNSEVKRNHWLVLNQYAAHSNQQIPSHDHDHDSICSYENKKYKALCLNGHTTVFRAKLLGLLAKKQLINPSNTAPVLYSCRNDIHKNTFEEYANQSSTNFLPKLIDNDTLQDLSVDPCLRSNPAFFWEDTFFKITLETNHFWHNDSLVMLTEKWLKSILYLKPSFTLCEQSGVDTHIESLGFDIYRDFINRDYDTVLDEEQRLNSFVDSFNATKIPSPAEWKDISDRARANYAYLVDTYIPKLEEDFFAAIG